MRKFLLLLLLTVTLPVMAHAFPLPSSDILTPMPDGKPAEKSAELMEVPDADRLKANAAIPPQLSDAQWGEWYEYDKGTFYSVFAYPQFFDSSAIPITLDRRDDLGGSGYSQIRFNKLFGDVDFIAYLDNNTKRMSWEEMELPYTHEQSTYEGNFVHLMAVSGMEWSLKRDMYLNFWFCIEPNYGYNFSDCFYRSQHVITDWKFSVEWEGVTNDMYCYNNTQTEAILKYTPDPRVKRTQVLWYNSADYNSTDFSSIAKYNPEAATLNEGDNIFPFFDGAGTYVLAVAFFDEENDRILGSSSFSRVISNLFNPDEWEDVGVGKFDPTLFDNYRRFTYDDVMSYSPDVASFAPYDVKIIRRKDNPEIIRVVNPFNTGTPFENIDISYGIFNGYSSVFNEYYDNETRMEIYFYHDQDYFIEIDTREDEYGCGLLKANQFSGFYWGNWSNPFSGDVAMDDGVIRDKYGDCFILTLPDTGSVNEVIDDETDAAPVYYNLQGQPVANPANGIYIVRRGAKVTKEYVL